MALRQMDEYLSILEKMYPNVPYETIKKLERKIKNETELKEELEKLNEMKK